MAVHPNKLLAQLSGRDQRLMLAAGETVRVASGEILCEPGEAIGSVYFPTSGTVSLLSLAAGRAGFGRGVVGREGMIGTPLVLRSATAMFRAVVQASATALRIDAAKFSEALLVSQTLQRSLLGYVGYVMDQVASSVVCARFHDLESRLAGCLLVNRDRGESCRFHVTHGILAGMLGVRRSSISLAAYELQRRGLIEYHRGEVSVIDAIGLEDAACQCYKADRARMSARENAAGGRHPGRHLSGIDKGDACFSPDGSVRVVAQSQAPNPQPPLWSQRS